ncbi:cardiac-enriched FHL2-interacting protein [Tautogolabrus adspersus]
MTSVEKRRSGRKSGGHRKHSDGGYSDTSSAGSFLDETDREVSSLTDRAFRSLCIGDEAVYNDSDLGASSPCTQRDRQLAFSQSAQDRDREREELKRTAHESFSLRMQQYEQNWIHGGMYGAEIQRDPQWEDYGERTQGRVSATFQHSFVETSQQEESLRGEQLSFLSNGATEVSSQQRRSRSRVSSLIRAFNSEGQRDGAGMDGKPRELNDDTSWDKSALMSIQRELSEFSTSYQENFNSGHFGSAGPFSSRDTDFYSSEVAAMSHINSGPSFMRSSHSKHSMSTQVNCNSNFFIHSEFSPFKVWRDHNRFPFQQGEVSGFMHYPDFAKWYETPMYKELSLESQPQVPHRFEERGMRHLRNNWAPVVPTTPPRATSTSTMLHRASAVEKRCDSELAGHYTYRKRAQSLGTNRLPPQRPSTASPTIEMSRRVQDTISSVRALQQKIKMMTEQNVSTEMTMNKQGVSYSNDYRIPYGNHANTVAPNVVNSNTSTTPFNISQLLTPVVHAHQESETSEVRQSAVSPQLVEHPPVRAESRGATPDIRMSSYKSRATSLLFNLKDNRKRVKSTYSPTKFKGLETQDKNKQPLIQEPRDTVIDIPDFPDAEVQYPQVGESGWTNAVSHNYVNQHFSPGSSIATNYGPATANTGQYSEYTSSGYQTAQMQGEMVPHSGFTSFLPENYTRSQLANGQNLYEDLSSFTPYKKGMMDNVDAQGRDGYRLKPPYTATETPRLNAEHNHTREFLTKVDGYPQHKDSDYDYKNVSSQDRWRQANSQDTKYHSLNADSYSWKQDVTASMEKGQHQHAYQGATMTKEELHLPRDKYRGENHHDIHKEPPKKQSCEDFGGTSYAMEGFIYSNISNQHPQYSALGINTKENQAYYGHQQPGAFKDNYGLQKQSRHNKENEINDYTPKTSNRFTNQENRNQHTPYLNKDYTILAQETGQIKPYTTIPYGYEMQSLQAEETKPAFEHNMQNNANPANATDPTMENQAKDRTYDEVKAEQAMAVHVKAQHAQAELAVVQHWDKEQRPKEELARLNLAGQNGSEKVKAEQVFAELSAQERVNQDRAGHAEEKKKKDDLIKQSTEKQPEQTNEVLTKAEQTIVPRVTEPSHITEEAGAEHMKEEQEGQVKVEQAEAERFKEHIKTELEETEQTRIRQSKTEKAKQERIKAEKLEEEKLKAEKAERERIKAEQIRTEKVKAEEAEAERRTVEHAELQQIEEQAKAEQEKVEVGDKDLIQATRVNDANITTLKSKAKVERVKEKEGEQENSKQTKVITTKLEQTKIEMMQEESAKQAPKLISSQQVKSELDKVEQAKTELAKAKAELAKIKEKMKGEQKQRVKNTVLTKDEIKKDVPANMDTDKNEEFTYQDQSTKPEHQHNKDLIVACRQSIDQANRGLDEFNRLRDKYGFTDTPAVRNKISAAGNSSSNDANETPLLCLDKFETKTEEKSKDKRSPSSKCSTPDTENNKVSSFESLKLTESQYIYSESSKEFKLSSGNNVLPDVDNATNSDSVTDEVKEHRVEKLETCNPLIQPDVSQQKDSNVVILLPAGRKTKVTEQSVGPSKDPHSNPPKTLSHKERAQTKQEILTSKIKAHAEKEISAIKEKGFAKRDGIISKTSTKQLGGSQIINARQRPPSQEAPKKHDSTMSSNATLKHHMEPQGTKMVPATSVSPSSSATIPVKSAATTSQSQDHSQKVIKEPMNGNMPKPPKEAKLTGLHPMRTDNSLVENQNKENQSPINSKEQPPKTQQLKQESNHEENSGNKTDGPKDNLIGDTVNLIQEKEAPPVVEIKSSEPTTTEKAESTHEAVLEDSSLNLVFGQNKTPVADDSLQIRGIMVTVRERKPSLSDVEINYNTPDQIKI